MQEPNLEFYSAASQLIPLLFITFLVERYVKGEEGLSGWGQVRSVIQVLALIAVFVMGEVVALQVLADANPTESKKDFVAASLGVGTALIIIPFLVRFGREMSDTAGKVMEIAVSLAFVVAVVLILIFA